MKLLEVEHLKKHFPVRAGFFKRTVGYYKAVNDISFSLDAGETFGLVGESGCGKTTVGKSILRLIEPTEGLVKIEGRNVTAMTAGELMRERKNMQMIFQDPYSSLNPRMTVYRLIAEPLLLHKLVDSKKDCEDLVKKTLEIVGLDIRDMEKYPHEFSGGQRQRIMIARALAVSPKLVVCDEPVSALDVSVQAQILNLMKDLQQQLGVSYLFIAHGMPVVAHISKRVGVMYLGNLVEIADSDEIFFRSLHPYTRALIEAIPKPDPNARSTRNIVKGEVPSLVNPPPGCLFSNRCPHCIKECQEVKPTLHEVYPGHMLACHHV